jgi:6-phosphogluconate dehydrogenase
MGANMVQRLLRAGHECVVFDVHAAAVQESVRQGATGAATLSELVAGLRAPRAVWLMVPAAVVDGEIDALKPLLERGDILIDGGNSHYHDDLRRARELAAPGIHYVDVGTSGGVFGLQRGYCLMIGGEPAIVRHLDPLFAALAPGHAAATRTPGRRDALGQAEQGYLHCGPSGAGHFVKMVHNGIEYGLMAAYAEGYELLAAKDIVKDVPGAFKAWSRGTVVRSWLLDLMVAALEDNPELEDVSDFTNDSGEGRWTVEEAIALGVPMPVISASLFARFASRQQVSPSMQAVAALRGQFGGHQVMTIAEGEALRQGKKPAAPAKRADATHDQRSAQAKKEASQRASARSSKANVEAAKASAASAKTPPTRATDVVDTELGTARAARKAPATRAGANPATKTSTKATSARAAKKSTATTKTTPAARTAATKTATQKAPTKATGVARRTTKKSG